MHTSLKWAETELRAPSLPPRSGGEGDAAPEGGAPGGGWCNYCAQTPPTPDPSPPLASARGGRGAERPVVSLSRCVHALALPRGRAESGGDSNPSHLALGVSSRRVLLGLAGSVSLAALTAVGAVLA